MLKKETKNNFYDSDIDNEMIKLDHIMMKNDVAL